MLALWDTSENEGVERRFSSRAQGVASSSSTGATDISSSFKNAYDLGEELARQEEEERKQSSGQQGKKKSGKSKGKK